MQFPSFYVQIFYCEQQILKELGLKPLFLRENFQNFLQFGLIKRWFGLIKRCFLCSKNSGPAIFGLIKRLGLLTSGFINRCLLYFYFWLLSISATSGSIVISGSDAVYRIRFLTTSTKFQKTLHCKSINDDRRSSEIFSCLQAIKDVLRHYIDDYS